MWWTHQLSNHLRDGSYSSTLNMHWSESKLNPKFCLRWCREKKSPTFILCILIWVRVIKNVKRHEFQYTEKNVFNGNLSLIPSCFYTLLMVSSVLSLILIILNFFIINNNSSWYYMISFSQKMDFQENVKFFLVDQFLWNVLYWVFF